MRRRSLMIATAAALALSACSTVQRSSRPTLQPNAVWAVAPFVNHTETPMAGRRAQSIVTEWLAAS
ncbi:MAG: penicillin-binding protein activator LpoB, partial [Tepidimonas taiwanensis]|nr:penicillin-binding protein activator LpoB [Tepidimonas taiwanensis]